MTTSGARTRPLTWASIASSRYRLVPRSSARTAARWIVGPSARGSENGMPTSITSAPRASASSMSRAVVSRLGSPATKYGMRPRSPRSRTRANAWSMRDTTPPDHAPGLAGRRAMGAAGGAHRVDVLVPAPGEPDHQARLARQRGRDADGMGNRMGRLERRDDALEPGEQAERVEGFLVGDRGVLRPAGVLEPRMLGSHSRVVKARRDRVRRPHLPVLVLDHVGQATVQHPGDTRREWRPVTAAPEAGPGRLDADQPDLRVTEERMEEAQRVRPTADTRHQDVRQPVELAPHLAADHRLEVAHHHRVRMRPGGGADAVIGRPDVGHPVPERLVHRVLEGPAPGAHWDHARAEQLHAEDVQRLARGVLLTHVDDALETEERRDRRGGHAVLPGAGLRDDPGLLHARGQEPLAERVVDLVGPGVAEVLALEIDPRAA